MGKEHTVSYCSFVAYILAERNMYLWALTMISHHTSDTKFSNHVPVVKKQGYTGIFWKSELQHGPNQLYKLIVFLSSCTVELDIEEFL